jgi:hypothetical protein
VASAGAARADPTAPPSAFGYEARAFIALNPGAVSLGADFFYRRRLYASNAPLLAQNEVMVQVGGGLSPGSARPIARVSIQPLSILRLWVQYEGEGYFGILSFARSFRSPADNYGRGVFTSPPAGPPGTSGAYPLWINKIELGARLQLQLRQWSLRSSWRAAHYDASLAPGDRVLYDTWIDNVVYAHGWALLNENELGYTVSPEGPLIGLRATVTFVFYPAEAYAPGEPNLNLNSPAVKVGPMVRYPLLRPDPRRRKITQLLLQGVTQFYLVDRFHTDGTTPSFVPYVSVALLATGDL